MAQALERWRGGCPRCRAPLAIGERDSRGGRVMCAECHTGSDIVALRSEGEGPLRSYALVRLEPEERAPPAFMEDLSGDGRTRHVRILPMFTPHMRRWRFGLGLAVSISVMLTLSVLAILLIPWGNSFPSVQYALVILSLGTALGVGGALVRRMPAEEILLEDGHLEVRRAGLFPTRRTRVPIAEIERIEVSSSRRDGCFLGARLRGDRTLPLVRGFSQGEEPLSWLREHLLRGLAQCRR